MEENRKPPSIVRIGRLQDRQLDALVELEQLAKHMYVTHGFGPGDVHARTLVEVVALTKAHNVRVAEADDVVAGYLAWRDESPGVGYLEQLCVHPKYQRFRVGSRLVQKAREEAKALNLPVILARCRAKAPWASAFLTYSGFKAVDDNAPAPVAAWCEEQRAKGGLAKEGELLMYAGL